MFQLRKARRFAHGSHGFTLIEMLTVIVVIILLAGMIVRGAKYAARKSDISRAKAQMEQIRLAIEEYRMVKGYYPPKSHASTAPTNSTFNPLLIELVTVPSAVKYLSDVFDTTQIGKNSTNAIMSDPWGRDWVYTNRGSFYDVSSSSCTNGELDGI